LLLEIQQLVRVAMYRLQLAPRRVAQVVRCAQVLARAQVVRVVLYLLSPGPQIQVRRVVISHLLAETVRRVAMFYWLPELVKRV
jgi:hypothetical protein